jgi:hypothetical protein
MHIPDTETLRMSAIAYLRDTGCHGEADLLSRCRVEISNTGHRYTGTTVVGLNIMLQCRANDVALFTDSRDGWDLRASAGLEISSSFRHGPCDSADLAAPDSNLRPGH